MAEISRSAELEQGYGDAPARHFLDFLARHHAADMAHGQGTLLTHLVGTWTILRGWGLDEATCNAGLFHSVYGTDQYGPVCIDLSGREAVRTAIGERAERLAHWFCRMSRPSLLVADRSGERIAVAGRDAGESFVLDHGEFSALVHILLANWLDQRPSVPPEVVNGGDLRFVPLAEVLCASARAVLASLKTVHGQDSAFAYTCARCGRCCIDKRIQVNPYEIARLARAKRVSTAEARARFVDETSALMHAADGRCVFLGEGGCTVYADRPLVCRQFPLARHVDAEGVERFSEARRDWVGGTFHEGGPDHGTVRTFLEGQGVAPFVDAADRYFAWYLRARAHLERAGGETQGDPGVDLLDMDGQIGLWCAARGVVEPTEMEVRLSLHLGILEAHLNGDDDG